MQRRAFTLIELLVVIAIIVTLASLVFGAVIAMRSSAEKNQAKIMVSRLYTALSAYLLESGLPSSQANTDGFGINADGSLRIGEVTDTVKAKDVPTLLQRMIDRETLSIDRSKEIIDGNLVDPWQQPWRLVLGAASDGDGNTPSTVAGVSPHENWAVLNDRAPADYQLYLYSYGPNNAGGSETDLWITPTRSGSN